MNIKYAVAILAIILSSILSADDSYSPYVSQDFPATVYWGDTHLHTNLSIDAYAFGTTLGPAEAYRFAQGDTKTFNSLLTTWRDSLCYWDVSF